MQETLAQFLVRKIPCRRNRLFTPVFLAFPDGSDSEEYPCIAGDLGSIPGLGRSPGAGKDYLLQCSCLENPMDRGACQAAYNPRDCRGWDTTEPLSLLSINKPLFIVLGHEMLSRNILLVMEWGCVPHTLSSYDEALSSQYVFRKWLG